MRLATPCRQCIAAAASNTTMSSSGFNSRGRSVWGRGLCDSPGSGGRGRGGSYVSGDSHTRSVRDANYGYRHGYGGNFGFPGGGPQQPFRTWQPVASRPPPRPKPADYRNWVFSLSQPPPQCERFTVLSYNILADYLARDHQPKLYFHIPSHILDWEWRKRKLLFEFGLWSSDIMCLQEVDRFHDLEEELTIQGYSGIWKMRTGTAVDGCAIFWRTNRFDLCHEEQIEFNKLGLRDNVAQICVLESRSKSPAGNSSSAFPTSPDHPSGANRVVICNIHVLYNPKRGEIKLGQVRTLLDRAYAVSRIWSDAPVVICGDFNCTPKSPLYNYLSEKKLNLSGLARDQVSGQHSARLYAPQPYFGSGLYRAQPHRDDTVLDAAAVKQGSYCTGIQNQHKPQNDVENASLSNNITFPQKIMSMLDVSGNSSSYNLNRHEENAISDDVTKEICQESFDGHCTGSNSGPRSVVDSLKESCDRISETTTNLGNDRGQQVTAPTLCEDHLIKAIVSEHCEIVHDVDYSKSSSGKSDEQMHRSSFKGQELSYGLVDSSLEEVKNSSNFCTGNPSVSTELLYDVSGLSSSENTSENVSLNAAVSFSSSTVGSSSDSITKEKSAFAGQNSFVCKNLGSSICSDSALDLDSINSSLDGLGKTTLEDGRFTEIQTEEASQSLGEPLPASGLLVGQFEGAHSKSNELISDSYCGHFGQNDKLSSNFPHSEDMSDPNFLEELHGKDRVYEFGVDLASLTLSSSQPSPSSFPGSHETNNSSSLQGHHVLMEEVNFERLNVTLSHQPQLDSSGFVQERNMYDPSLWTPMEIETASGNAECTDLEHNLKLKSAYAEVEDYAGTKDSNREPQVTSYNRQFMGTVDYIWFSEGLETVKVLDTIPKHVLQRTPGFPTQKWGSDHLAIACQLAFRRGAVK